MYMIPFSQLPSIFPSQQSDVEPSSAIGKSRANVPFVDMLRDSLANMQELRGIADQDSVDLALGNTEDLHTLGINAAKASVATTFTTQVATRALNAYNEILRMQV